MMRLALPVLAALILSFGQVTGAVQHPGKPGLGELVAQLERKPSFSQRHAAALRAWEVPSRGGRDPE